MPESFNRNNNIDFGLRLMEESDYEGALEIFSRIEEGEADPEILLYMGDCLRKMHRFEEARQAYTRSLERLPNHPEALLGLAIALEHLHLHEEALEAYQRVTQLNRAEAKAFFGVAVMSGKLGRHEDAVAAYKRAFELSEDWTEATYFWGRTTSHLTVGECA